MLLTIAKWLLPNYYIIPKHAMDYVATSAYFKGKRDGIYGYEYSYSAILKHIKEKYYYCW